MRTQTVMVVDDEAAIRSLVTTVLAANGYQVVEAGDGHTALQRAGDDCDGIDLLLTDIRMPGMDGFVLARSFLNSHPSAKVLFMSGYFESNEPCPDFIRKPFKFGDLLARVNDVLGELRETSR